MSVLDAPSSRFPYAEHDNGIVLTQPRPGEFEKRPMTTAELAAREPALAIAKDIYRHANYAGVCYIEIWEIISRAMAPLSEIAAPASDLVQQLESALINSEGKDFNIRADFVREVIAALSESQARLAAAERKRDVRVHLWKIAAVDVLLDLSSLADEEEAKATQRLEMSDSWRKHRRERAKRLIRLVSILGGT